MANVIPLQANTPRQQFSVEVGDYALDITFSWVARFEYFRVDITDITSGRELLTAGRIAHPDVNLLEGIDGYGTLIMTGPQATLANLGVTALLTWEAP